jgi:hypothetical protein
MLGMYTSFSLGYAGGLPLRNYTLRSIKQYSNLLQVAA